MIVTLTPNPSIDRTITLAGPLARGAVQRVETTTDQAGGKGINISRAAVTAGLPTQAILPARDRDPFVVGLGEAGINATAVGPAGEIRVNIAVTEPDGTTTKLNGRGEPADPALLTRLVDEVLAAASADGGPVWVVLAGSLPPGAPDDFYADLTHRLLLLPDARVAVDTSEAPLAAVVGSLGEGAPHLMKPNGEELASFTGGDPERLEADPPAAAAAARQLIDRGVGAVLATLGPHGAVLSTRDGSWHATPPPTTVVSTVGAGDSSLFGYLLGDTRGLGPADRLALAVAYGSAAAGLPGTTIPDPSQVDPARVQVRALPLDGAPS